MKTHRFVGRFAGLVLSCALSVGCAGRAARASRGAPSSAARAGSASAGVLQEGLASFYGRAFDGRPTASGERFSSEAFTCAHPKLPFGTTLRVTHLKSGRKVVVRVNDRGPFVQGRVIDLSLAAARELGMLDEGVAQVRVERMR